MKLNIKSKSTANFSVSASTKKSANKTLSSIVDIYQIFSDSDTDSVAASNNRFSDNKDANNNIINTATVAKISLNKKNLIITDKIAKQKRKKEKNKLLALKNYILVFIAIFDDSNTFKQNSRLIAVCSINS